MIKINETGVLSETERKLIQQIAKELKLKKKGSGTFALTSIRAKASSKTDKSDLKMLINIYISEKEKIINNQKEL